MKWTFPERIMEVADREEGPLGPGPKYRRPNRELSLGWSTSSGFQGGYMAGQRQPVIPCNSHCLPCAQRACLETPVIRWILGPELYYLRCDLRPWS